jgi:hypothetical protein
LHTNDANSQFALQELKYFYVFENNPRAAWSNAQLQELASGSRDALPDEQSRS